MFILIILDIIIGLLDILFLALLLGIIQFYIQHGDNRLSFLPGWLADRNSVTLIATFLIFFAAKNVAGFLIANAHYTFNGSVALRITRKNLYNYQHGPFEEFISVDSSVHIRKINLPTFRILPAYSFRYPANQHTVFFNPDRYYCYYSI
ncbi:MAG: hypothetical protein WDN26_04105 [Chitinophagaceae bacterium]